MMTALLRGSSFGRIVAMTALLISITTAPSEGHTVDGFLPLKLQGFHAPFGHDESATYTETWGADGLAFLGSQNSGVAIMDLAEDSLDIVSVFGADLGIGFYDVRTQGDFGYFSTREQGTLIVDLSVPSNPTEVSNVSATSEGFDVVTNAMVSGDYLFQVSAFSSEIAVTDISNPASPEFVTRIDTGDSVGIYDLTVADNRLYAAGLGGSNGEGAAYIYDVADQGEFDATLVAQIPTGMQTASVSPNSDHTKLIVTHREAGGGIAAWDITKPTTAKLVDASDASDFGINAYSAGPTAVLGQTVYAAWHQAGVQVIDLGLLDETDTIFRTGAYGTSQASPLEKFVGNTSVYPVSHSQVLLADSRWGLYSVNATNVVSVPSIDLEATCADVAAGISDAAVLEATLNALGVLPGDADQNGAIEFVDFLALSRNFGEANVGYAGGDFNCDGEVQFPDFLILSRNFGESTAVATPEPATRASLLIGLLALSVLRCVKRLRVDCTN